MTYNVRLCTIVKRNDFEGYGFNLHSEANKPGQFIGHVEKDSPAHHAGLLKSDILIEVNGFNVCDENHQQVVNRIKENPQSVNILIIDPEGYSYCKAHNIEIKKELAKPLSITVVKKENNVHQLEKPTVVIHEEKLPAREEGNGILSDNKSDTRYDKISDQHSGIERSNTVKSIPDKANLEDLSIDEIRAKVAESGAKKRRDRQAPNSFKDRANMFEQL